MTNSKEDPDRADRFGIPLTRRAVIALSFGFSIAFTLIAWLVVVVRRQSFWSLFEGGQPLPAQVVLGLMLGATVAAAATLVVLNVAALAGFRRLVRDIFAALRPTRLDLVIIAVNAGWSEELLFRGIVQPAIGIWLTSLAFVIVHGVVDPRSRGRLAFGLFVFAASVGLGLLYEQAGLAAAMVAHAAYDLVVLLALHRELLRNT